MAYSSDEPRDAGGKWTSGGSDSNFTPQQEAGRNKLAGKMGEAELAIAGLHERMASHMKELEAMQKEMQKHVSAAEKHLSGMQDIEEAAGYDPSIMEEHFPMIDAASGVASHVGDFIKEHKTYGGDLGKEIVKWRKGE